MSSDTAAGDGVVQMVRESVRDFAAREKDLSAFRLRMRTWPGHDAGQFARMQDLGWRTALVGEPFGGAGMGLHEAAAIAEELGGALLGEPFVATAVLPVRLLQDGAARTEAGALLQRAAAGEATLALAWQEQSASIDAADIATEARPRAGGHVLSGRKAWVAGASAATDLLVSARCGAGIGVYHVPRDAPGLVWTHAWQADGTPACVLALDAVELPATAELVPPAAGAAALARALDAAAVVASAELLGLARSAFDMTLAYMRTRVQFDKPIGSFQALQHKAADLLVQRELSAAVLEEALAVFDGPDAAPGQRAAVAARCKARCSDAALRITRECIQLHGAIGYTHEYDLGLYLKRALVLAAWLGNGAQQRRRHATLAVRGAPV